MVWHIGKKYRGDWKEGKRDGKVRWHRRIICAQTGPSIPVFIVNLLLSENCHFFFFCVMLFAPCS